MMNPDARFLVASLAAIVAGGALSAHAELYDYATTTGYAALTSGTTASATLQGNAVTINTGTRGGGITLGTAKQITFAGETPLTNLSNPGWIAGTRSFFDITYHRGVTPDSSVAMEILFSQPLPASSYLVFVDFDAREVLNIKAYDQSSNLIADGVLTFSRQNGNTADGALLTYPTWNTLGGYTGSLVTGTFATTIEPVVSLQTCAPWPSPVWPAVGSRCGGGGFGPDSLQPPPRRELTWRGCTNRCPRSRRIGRSTALSQAIAG